MQKMKQETNNTKKFTELFSQLGNDSADDQKQKVEEMKEVINEMDEEEFKSVFTKELLNEMDKMIKERMLLMGNAILLLKRIRYCNVLKNIWIPCFEESSLNKRFKKMIIEEDMKKDGKNEKLLVDLCECYLTLDKCFSYELLLICMLSILKAASDKEETDEVQKEVEMALLELSSLGMWKKIDQELYLNEIKEIIQYHQEHRNLTYLAYQSAWEFLIKRLRLNENLNEVLANELHSGREAARELEELSKCVDWKRKEEKNGRIEAKEVIIIGRWIDIVDNYLTWSALWNEELAGLISSIVQLFRASRDNYREISYRCIVLFKNTATNGVVKIEGLLESGAFDLILEELQQSTMDFITTFNGLLFFIKLTRRLNEEEDEKMEKEKRKELKRKVLERMEEEGYEDIIISFHEVLNFHIYQRFYYGLSLNISDYFVNV
ncbi:uncharacterized protein MONOS_5019 [Monocercomonoides exilis]|uniref:uncharacterized protein n=1 Tax=Monocercomonoides exilis TaxID=2049356 RepID=UPI00355AC198|nr:hypothetical protein MONOS_5019 [Monocercomonoides exilis]